ncbi:outer membrane lipoprotein carrier protein LolA [Amycolatopsis sp. PS_44_ISF1]|uniref:LolA family protein n=1 Tax=Amycolatopsis sp. PS_44_ISF1 TaxID=2974917 RepID=UPI0028DFC91B|nr:outer membrane lipoprotein carrier protein LolA [Amycolatopsis sp. PS_44_ISF1]MDT8911517.1 outer membrane lipoprotein carrier protein LolA [Amycolatopsis sp. PS_44_ISF1]
MDPKKKAITAAVVGTALGVGGLAVVAMPATAGAAPALPAVSAESLVQSVLTAKPGAFDGTVSVSNNLGLPSLGSAIPGAGALNVDSAHVFSDGAGKSKLALAQGSSQETIIHDGTTVWDYNSKNNTATKTTIPAGVAAKPGAGVDAGKMSDPAGAATELLAKVRESSTVSVDGTATVADRPAYELVLTPKPAERTLLREIRVAVDSQTRMPLRVSVLSNGTTTPALELAFSDIEFTPQAASEFAFTPPQGAKVTEKTAEVGEQAKAEAQQVRHDLKVVGDGWDTVVTGKLPAGSLTPKQTSGSAEGRGVDPQKLLSRVAKPVNGTWGSGYLVTTKVGTAVLTDDGRFAAGAVPAQVLYEALGTK